MFTNTLKNYAKGSNKIRNSAEPAWAPWGWVEPLQRPPAPLYPSVNHTSAHHCKHQSKHFDHIAAFRFWCITHRGRNYKIIFRIWEVIVNSQPVSFKLINSSFQFKQLKTRDQSKNIRTTAHTLALYLISDPNAVLDIFILLYSTGMGDILPWDVFPLSKAFCIPYFICISCILNAVFLKISSELCCAPLHWVKPSVSPFLYLGAPQAYPHSNICLSLSKTIPLHIWT